MTEARLREAEQAILHALRGRSGITFDELRIETMLDRHTLSAALFRLTPDRITYQGGVYMPRGVYPRKPKTAPAATASSDAGEASARSRRRRRAIAHAPGGGR